MDKEEIDGTMERAKTLCAEGKYKESIKIFQELRKKSVGFEDTRWINVFEGFALFGTCEYDEAMRLWNRTLDLKRVNDFANPPAITGMALSMAYHNEDIAEGYARFAMELLSELPDGQEKEWVANYIMPYVNMSGIVLIQNGNNAGAIRILEQATKISELLELSDDSEISIPAIIHRAKGGHYLAVALDAEEMYHRAIEELEAVIPRYKSVGAFLNIVSCCSRLGRIYEGKENYFVAMQWYKKCIETLTEAEVRDQSRDMQRAQQDMDRVAVKLAEEELRVSERTRKLTKELLEEAEDIVGISSAPELGEGSGEEGLYT